MGLWIVMIGSVMAQRGKRAIKRIDRDVESVPSNELIGMYNPRYLFRKEHGWQEERFPIPNMMKAI